jgi:hypothetical protein
VSNQRAARRLCEPAWPVSHRLSAVPIRREPAVQTYYPGLLMGYAA